MKNPARAAGGTDRSFRRKFREEKARLLEAAIAYLRIDDDMRHLLDQAGRQGLAIRMSDRLLDKTVNGKFVRSETSDKKQIFLKPCRTMLATAKTLAHELSHFYQTQDLGVKNERLRALEYQDVRTAVLVMRIKEADAVARANAAMQRLRGQPVTAAGMQQDFFSHLEKLGNYDLRRVRNYHGRYTRPGARLSRAFNEKSLKRDEKPVDIAALRRMLRTGIAPETPNYMSGIPDAVFESIVMGPVRADVRQAMIMIQKVEKDILAGKSRTKPARRARYALHEKITGL